MDFSDMRQSLAKIHTLAPGQTQTSHEKVKEIADNIIRGIANDNPQNNVSVPHELSGLVSENGTIDVFALAAKAQSWKSSGC